MLQRITLMFLAVFLISCGSNNSNSEVTESSSFDFAWYRPEIAFEERVQLLIDEMTIEEKISQLTYDAAPIERLGVPEYNWWSEALHGGHF
jgi:beta-glucosidase